MRVYFFDSSGAVKRYVSETGTTWVRSLLSPRAQNRVHVARITGVEVVSAITRRGRSGSLTQAEVATAITEFRHEFKHVYKLVAVTPDLLTRAMALVEDHGLRGYDAIQLAAALRVQSKRRRPITLVSADVERNRAALSEGLQVEDPNHHP